MANVADKHPELGAFLLQDVLLTGNMIGSGAYSSVEEGMIPGAVCAVKRFDDIFRQGSTLFQTDIEWMAEECCRMSTLRHTHIVQIFGICSFPESRLPALVMERMLTNLHDLLETRPNIPLPLKYSLLYDVTKGISYLHSRSPPLVHRDLSARNVLLNTAMEAKIGDLCAARLMRGLMTTTATKTPVVTIYMPPEVHAYNSRYEKTMDIFSFGVIAIVTLTQQFPAQVNRDQHQTTALNWLAWSREYMQQIYRQFREDHPLVQMIKKCLEEFQCKRPQIQEVMQLMEKAMAEVCDTECSMDRLELVQTVKKHTSAVPDGESKDQQIVALRQMMQTKEEEYLSEKSAKDAEIHRLQSQENESSEHVHELTRRIQSHQAEIHSQQAEIEQLKGQLQALQNERTTFLHTTTVSPSSSHSMSAPIQKRSSYGLEPGICGLNNLGSTCYMNSALQCLSNTEPLTKYFTKQLFKKHINKDNPLGTSGAIAETYNDLLQDLWSGKYSSLSPMQFKQVIDLVASQFSGDQQNDSQEFLAFLLDGLHEDLNLVKEKPHADMIIQAKGGDENIANEFWKKHLQRNDSIVVDLFQGQLRSTVKCSHCNEVSKTFDPFMFLSLPLPAKHMYSISVVVVRSDPMAQMMKFCVAVPWDGTVANVKEEISLLTEIKEEMMLVAKVSNGRFTRLYRDEDTLTMLFHGIYIYELRLAGHDCVHIWTYHYCNFLSHGVIPAIVSVPNKCTHRHIYLAVQNRCGKYMHVNESSRNKRAMEKKEELFQVLVADSQKTYNLPQSDTPIDPNSISYILCDWATENSCEIPTTKDIIEDSSCARSFESSKDTTLLKCLHLFTKKKKLGPHDAWFCSHCKSLVKATRKCDIWKLPSVLVVHLTRFTHNRLWKDKIHTLVDFPIENLDLSKYVKAPDQPKPVYDLFAVINHYGGMGGGHYTACCKNKTTGQWYDYHDSLVSKISEERVLTPAAYVLFYYRHEQDMDLD